MYNVGWIKASQDAAWILGLLEGFIAQVLAEREAPSNRKVKSQYKATGWGQRHRPA